MDRGGTRVPTGLHDGPSRKAPPTIHDVARMAGVSTSTVSRSLTGEPRVSAATRERVRRIADSLSYRPSRSAQSLRSTKTGTIGLLAPNLDNPIAYDHLQATVRAAFDLGYTVLVADGQGSAEIQDAELGRMRDFRIDGLAIGRGILPTTKTLLEFERSGVPVEPRIGESTLRAPVGTAFNPYRETTSDAVGATIGCRRLVSLGHRRFAVFVLAQSTTPLGRARNQLMEDILVESGIDRSDVVTVLLSDPSDSVAEVQNLAAGQNPPTAIISGNGRSTPFILEGVQSAGLRIPQDVSVLCFGDSQWHRGYGPPLSVIRDDYAAVARRTLERLIARIEGKAFVDSPPRPSEFVMRGSIGPVPRGPQPGTQEEDVSS